MTVKTITENGHQLTGQILQRTDASGLSYWQARAMFRVANQTARGDVITTSRHASTEAAERAAIRLARDHGWGRS